MRWRAHLDTDSSRSYEIKKDLLAGFYFYVFEDNKCIRDHLQDTFEIAIECAWEDYGVPMDAWEKVDD